MKRLLMPPIAALALLGFSMPTSVHAAGAEVIQLREEQNAYSRNLRIVLGQIARCETPDPSMMTQLQVQTNAVSMHAAGVAWQLGGRDHAAALGIQRIAEVDFWRVTEPLIPDHCYQPPA